MRVAFVGKGGVGKSAIAGTVARVLGRQGHKVLVIDSDPMPGLAYSVGLTPSDTAIPDDAVVERAEGEEGPRFRLRPDLDASAAVERFALHAPDGVRVLQFGKVGVGAAWLGRSQAAFTQVIDQLPAGGWSLVGDLPGGTRQPFAGWGDYAETMLIVVEPTSKSILSGRRLARLALRASSPHHLAVVVSKARAPEDAARVAAAIGLEVVGVVPWDDELAEAERRGIAPIDHSPDSPAVAGVCSLVDRLAASGTLVGEARP